MNLHKFNFLIVIGIGVLIVASALALTKSNKTISRPPKYHQEKQQTIDSLPLIVSQVKDLEVVKASLKNPGTTNPIAVLKIKNKSDKPVIAVSVETGHPEEASGITVNGFNDSDEPDVVIKPHGSTTVEFPLNNSKLGDPIRISGVVYADNSEEGEKIALETIRTQREHTKSNKLKINPSTITKQKGSSSPP